MSRRREAVDPPGQDSFLDVVANLVGILIILVVVIGAHAGQSWSDQANDQAIETEIESATNVAQQAKDEAGNRERHNLEIEDRIKQEQAIATLRKAERDRILLMVEAARSSLEEELQLQDEEKRADVELARQAQALNSQINDARRKRQALESQDVGPQKLDHLPTPIAKTVFTNELHFRLKNRRLAFVPLNELIEEMRNEWRVKADNLKFAKETVETVGPVNGFRMQYKLALVSQTVSTDYGTMRKEGPEFIGFVMLPISDQLGTPIEEALQVGSEFEQRLARENPKETTVTVWVYPDSYGDFGALKKWLYQRKFLTAGWPLTAESPISGGPNGYRSNAQ